MGVSVSVSVSASVSVLDHEADYAKGGTNKDTFPPQARAFMKLSARTGAGPVPGIWELRFWACTCAGLGINRRGI